MVVDILQSLAANDMLDTEASVLSAPSLGVHRLQLTFQAVDELNLPAFRGPMWRAVLGRALKRLSDTTEVAALWPPDLARFPLRPGPRDRLYTTLFSTEGPGGPFERVPSPFVLDAPLGPERVASGAAESLGLTLIGTATAALATFVACFAMAARAGLGKGRGRAILSDVVATWRPEGDVSLLGGRLLARLSPDVPVAPVMPPLVEVTLASPLRLVRQGIPIRSDAFVAGDLLEHAVRRISLLQRQYGEAPVAADFGRLLAMAREARLLEPALAEVDGTRWSANQGTEIPIGGLVGQFVLPMAGLAPLWPWLWAAQWLHVGKDAAMGLGTIRLKPLG